MKNHPETYTMSINKTIKFLGHKGLYLKEMINQ